MEVISRELRRPLLELRQLALGLDALGAEDQKTRDKMVQIAEHAMRRVDDLVRIERMEQEKMALESAMNKNTLTVKATEFTLEPVAVRAVCDDAVVEIAKLFSGATCQMRVRYSNRSRLVRANKDLLSRVVYNFLLDATHYANMDTKAELKVRERGEKVEISVRDFGPALPTKVWKEMQGALESNDARLGSPSSVIKNQRIPQGMLKPQAIAMRPGSSALGLYAASKFASFMHAEVGAVRHRDGTSFYVRLPAVKQLEMWSTK